MPTTKYICNGCDEEFYTKDYGDFRKCERCGIETCTECGRWVDGKIYCRDCKPVETNYYDRSVE